MTHVTSISKVISVVPRQLTVPLDLYACLIPLTFALEIEYYICKSTNNEICFYKFYTSLFMITYKNIINMISDYINIWCLIFIYKNSYIIKQVTVYVTIPVGQSVWRIGAELIKVPSKIQSDIQLDTWLDIGIQLDIGYPNSNQISS